MIKFRAAQASGRRGGRGRGYVSGYGRGPGKSTLLKGRPPETSSHGLPRRAETWGTTRRPGREREIRALRGQVRAIEARLRYLDKGISRIEPGFTPSDLRASVDPKRCVACGTCQDVCPTGAIYIEEIARVDLKGCIGCGSCVTQCPRGAIRLTRLGPVQPQPF